MEVIRRYLSANYKPDQWGEAAHKLPHVNLMTGGLESGEFLQPDFQTYFLSLVTAPMIVLILCIISCVFFLLAMLLRCCCHCIKCKPREMPETEADKLLLIKRRNNKLITFLVFVCLIIVADHAGFWGMAKFNEGMTDIQKGLNTLGDNFDYLDSEVTLMEYNSGQISYYMDELDNLTPSCSTSSVGGMDSLNSGIETLSGLTGAPGPMMSTAKGYIQQYAIEGKNSAYYIFYAILLAVAVLYLIALKFRSICAMRFLVALSFILTILLTLFYVVEWIVVSLFGDLCYDVTDNLVGAVPAGDLKDILKYYTKCEGTNPFKSPAEKVENALNTLSSDMSGLTGAACTSSPGSYYIDEIEKYIALIQDENLVGVETSFNCGPYMTAYDLMVEQGICTKGLGGMFVMWVCHIFMAWGIAISMFTATLVWQYFEPEYWNLTKDNMYEKPPEQEITAVPVGGYEIQHYADSGHVQMTVTQHPPKHENMI